MTYTAPVRDLLFALNEVGGFAQLRALPKFADCDDATVTAILEAGGKLAAEQLAPLNRAGDTIGAQFENGRVRAVPGFAAAYKQFVDGGWGALASDPGYGGQGLPKALEVAVFEMIHASNMAFGLCPMLTRGAVEALTAHGTAHQKQLYLPKLISGEWTGTMNLTEPQSGSDLGTLRTRAEPDGNGGYRVTGTKIFITWGDHDMTDNIVHLVLARLPDAPAGSRGISLFLVLKRHVAGDGTLGAANTAGPSSIEHKLGIHGSPTCVMQFEGARGELVGEINQGLAHMFTMMNAARLQVGTEGVGIAERAYQQALAYALERRQGRSAWTGELNAPIFDHPDIRRSLMLMKAKIEAARAICLSTALAADLAEHATDDKARGRAQLRAELLTPIAKAWSTDIGVEIASMGVQIHGGMGFIEETGAAQHYRDARIAPIYEGTNGIQAIDLMGRKLALGNGQAVRDLLDEIWSAIGALKSSPNAWLHSVGARLEACAGAAQTATSWMVERRGHAQPDALAGATAYLKLLGDLTGGWMLAKGALAAAKHTGDDPDQWWATRIGLARVFADQVLAQSPGLAAGVTAGAIDLVKTSARALGAG
ncbi:MAG: acyl-CoA dehydrogenase [Alphaproteobacteria bacterium]|nr:acyl-CoA dehydrogenase [Alphaproteobacteria bacterium]MBL6937245.1 acyl-CoA dehydrogenase [Alphaproteobacteria bacterium]MBL7096193.1 acyl-CoA dehydrogenase [Alphaproteobacteria bacterium]